MKPGEVAAQANRRPAATWSWRPSAPQALTWSVKATANSRRLPLRPTTACGASRVYLLRRVPLRHGRRDHRCYSASRQSRESRRTGRNSPPRNARPEVRSDESKHGGKDAHHQDANDRRRLVDEHADHGTNNRQRHGEEPSSNCSSGFSRPAMKAPTNATTPGNHPGPVTAASMAAAPIANGTAVR